jgi:hypothetical protein
VSRLEPSAAIRLESPSIHEVASNGCPESKDSFPRISAYPGVFCTSQTSASREAGRLLSLPHEAARPLTRRISPTTGPSAAPGPQTNEKRSSAGPSPMSPKPYFCLISGKPKWDCLIAPLGARIDGMPIHVERRSDQRAGRSGDTADAPGWRGTASRIDDRGAPVRHAARQASSTLSTTTVIAGRDHAPL